MVESLCALDVIDWIKGSVSLPNKLPKINVDKVLENDAILKGPRTISSPEKQKSLEKGAVINHQQVDGTSAGMATDFCSKLINATDVHTKKPQLQLNVSEKIGVELTSEMQEKDIGQKMLIAIMI